MSLGIAWLAGIVAAHGFFLILVVTEVRDALNKINNTLKEAEAAVKASSAGMRDARKENEQ